MLGFLSRRIAQSLLVVLLVTMISYAIISLAPGDAVDLLMMQNITPEQAATMREQLGLNRPMHIRYLIWLRELASGNLGYSTATYQPVLVRIMDRVVPTLTLMGMSLLFAYIIAIPLGVIAAVKKYSTFDYVATILGFTGVSLPNFFFGLGAIYFFSIKLGWFPTGGVINMVGPDTLMIRLHHAVLPALVMGLSFTGMLMRFTRSSMLEVLNDDYVRTARAKGLNEARVVLKHALRNALIPQVTLLGLWVPRLLGGAVIVEQIFQWPGMGRLALEAIVQRDYPVLMGLNLILAIMVMIGNLVADMLYGLLDPRVRDT